ncbi:MAG: hypothetical protein HYT40_02145 [Candidatus Sungbacteria bacterium]|uniref:Uncharacterized protein n=1 Tax=Candidatus Sungiibacteriota bacterium TaxID=2750080 RepID=A0A931SD75_9BACT|nr:hypothetical protein [Candidatus Sungbacteria bacterium]
MWVLSEVENDSIGDISQYALGSLGLGLAWEALYRLGLSEVPGIITVSRRKSELLRRAEETRNAVPAFPSAVPSAGDSRAGIAPV